MQSILLLVIVSVICHGHSVAQDQPRRYCGRQLANTIAAVCSLQNPKRSGMYNSILKGYYDHPYWIATKRALGFQTRGKRYETVTEDCCLHACTLDTMLSYCESFEG